MTKKGFGPFNVIFMSDGLKECTLIHPFFNYTFPAMVLRNRYIRPGGGKILKE
ncbi:MAG: hypothetical protein JSV24_02310 [Bacteroidales bacterium]|nr:MAG: hypothetical protein JSV24_02310 [Bacteroidales bacterium]